MIDTPQGMNGMPPRPMMPNTTPVPPMPPKQSHTGLIISGLVLAALLVVFGVIASLSFSRDFSDTAEAQTIDAAIQSGDLVALEAAADEAASKYPNDADAHTRASFAYSELA